MTHLQHVSKSKRSYKQRHEYYCGIDLHANSMHVCVVDHAGQKHLHKNFDTKKPETFLLALGPFRKRDLIIGCESTFNWYWLADLCTAQNLPSLLGHALYLKAIHGGKTKTDRIDSEKLAMLLRGGNFPTSYVSQLATRKSGKPTQYDRGENRPLEKICKVSPRYRYVLLDF